MSPLRLKQLDSADAIRDAAPEWDRLWERSAESLPTARAELVAQWLEHFSPSRRVRETHQLPERSSRRVRETHHSVQIPTPHSGVRALVIERDGIWLAALPLVGRRICGMLPVGDLTRNYWSPGGELLLDRHADPAPVLDALAEGMAGLPWPLLWLDAVRLDAVAWRDLLGRLGHRYGRADSRVRAEIGELILQGCFDDYQARRSARHRYNLRRCRKRLERTGRVRYRFHPHLEPDEVEPLLRQAFEIEQRSWKRGAGGSVLGTPGMFQFFQRQAVKLAGWGYLRLAFLEHDGRPIAFELGYSAKSVYHSAKISYDAAYRTFGPGQLLRGELIRWLHQQPGQSRIDFHGELRPSLARWTDHAYPIGRVVLAPQTLPGRAAFAGYKVAGSVVRGWRQAMRTAKHHNPPLVPEAGC